MTIKEWIASILSGMALMADQTGALQRPTASKTDEEAIRSDWQTVGDDLRKAMREVSKDDNVMKRG